MKLRAIFFGILVSLSTAAQAQIEAPRIEAVYGGRINAIHGYALTTDSSRIYISTESANSVFYADVFSNSASPSFGNFQAVESMNSDDGFGDGISEILAHEASGAVFMAHQQAGLIRLSPDHSTVDTLFPGFINAMYLHNSDTLLILNAQQLYAYEIDASGNATQFLNGIATGLSPSPHQTISVRPDSSIVFIHSGHPGNHNVAASNGQIYKLTNSSTFKLMNFVYSAGAGGDFTFKTLSVAPDGDLYFFGDDNLSKALLHAELLSNADSVFIITSNSISIIGDGVDGSNSIVKGDTSAFSLYHAKLYNHNNANSSDWHTFGNSGLETNPNDGWVYVDPVNPDIVYMTTDQGIGVSVDGGATIFEIDEGVEAVQVSDFDMTQHKHHGWLASKSGIRQVVNYQTATPLWTNALFPNGDGSPYYSIEIDPTDSLYVYAGNVRIYQSMDDGATWNMAFTPEHAPYNFSNIGTRALAIEVLPYDSTVVFAAYEVQGSDKGGLFYSVDRGMNWDQILLEASTIGPDVDVSDIVFTIEGSDTIAYAGAMYDLTAPQGRSVYKLTKNGDSWSASQDMNSGGTSTGSLIVATINDMELSTTGDTVYAVGTDAGVNHPITYYKDLSGSALWTPNTVSGFPFSADKEATAAAVGKDTLFVSVDNEIYYYKSGASSWTLGYSYPVGTRVNTLYYDELLAGTGSGFYAHYSLGGTSLPVEDQESSDSPDKFTLSQNYPNPFNPTTNITFTLPQTSRVSLKVYNLLGQEVAELVNGTIAAGTTNITFDAANLSSGIYIYRLKSGNNVITKRMVLIK